MERPRISDAIEYMNEVREFAQFFPCVDSGTLRKRRGEVQGFPVGFNHDEGKGVGYFAFLLNFQDYRRGLLETYFIHL